MTKKKYHYEGRDPDTGHEVFSECGTKKSLGLKIPEHGEPLHPGQAIVQIRPHADREHFEIDTILAREADGSVISGPARVTTDEYRKGWDATFAGDAGDGEQGRPN
jgi:hypothetical protein